MAENNCSAKYIFKKSNRVTAAAYIPNGTKCTLKASEHVKARNGSTIEVIHGHQNLRWIDVS